MYRDIPKELKALIEPLVEDANLELVDVLVSRGRPPWLLRVTIDTPLTPEKYEHGYKAMISSMRRCRTLLSGVKSTAYMVSVLARAEAQRQGLDEALLLNESGFITEGSLSNV